MNMANHPIKYNPEQNRTDTWKHNWEVMKPFVHFAIKAIGLIGGALIGIIKLLPTLAENKNHKPGKDNKIIKI
jgi:hypothetical protein